MDGTVRKQQKEQDQLVLKEQDNIGKDWSDTWPNT